MFSLESTLAAIAANDARAGVSRTNMGQFQQVYAELLSTYARPRALRPAPYVPAKSSFGVKTGRQRATMNRRWIADR